MINNNLPYNKIIVINTRFLLKGKLEGIGWFTYETIKRIILSNPDIEFHLLFDRPYDPSFVFAENVKPIVLGPPARHPLLWYLWFQWSVKNYLNQQKADLFISPDGFMTIGVKIPTLLVVHDIAFEHFPQQVNWLTSIYYRHFSAQFARAADRIATVSAYSKNDLIAQYQIPSEKIDVVFNGANEIFSPLNLEIQKKVRQRYTEGQDFFLYTGSIHPRKNLHRILLAFDHFKDHNNNHVKMLIVGRRAWQYGAVMEVYNKMKHKSEVIFTGHIQPEELSRIMGSAIALVYTSLFEGFGIPIIEAMQCGTPVITSNVSAMPETAGQAALLVNPHDAKEISKAMTLIYEDKILEARLRNLGIEQAKKFSWNNTAEALWQSALKILNARS
jgi:glycosyltransferase involved in cell wall biosynthesis